MNPNQALIEYIEEIREAVLDLRKMFRYHDKERIYNAAGDWNKRIKRVDALLHIEVDEEGKPIEGYYWDDLRKKKEQER